MAEMESWSLSDVLDANDALDWQHDARQALRGQ